MEYLIYMGEFAIAWFVGNLFSASITTIGCCLFCGLPIAQKLKPYSNCIDVKYVKSTYICSILLHTAVIAAASWAVVTYAPSMIQYGFFFSYAFTVLIGYRAWGRNEQNISECAALIEKHFIRGKEEEANAALFKVVTADGLEREALNKYLEILCVLFLIAGVIYAVYCTIPQKLEADKEEAYNSGYKTGYGEGYSTGFDEGKAVQRERDTIGDCSIIDLARAVREYYGVTPAEAYQIVEAYETEKKHGGYSKEDYENAIGAIWFAAGVFPTND